MNPDERGAECAWTIAARWDAGHPHAQLGRERIRGFNRERILKGKITPLTETLTLDDKAERQRWIV
jgi:hypothetical protein